MSYTQIVDDNYVLTLDGRRIQMTTPGHQITMVLSTGHIHRILSHYLALVKDSIPAFYDLRRTDPDRDVAIARGWNLDARRGERCPCGELAVDLCGHSEQFVCGAPQCPMHVHRH